MPTMVVSEGSPIRCFPADYPIFNLFTMPR
uniref:Uncharacterized protein n=1 Tax=Myoviridae sp. ctJ2i1 TaxID=2825079 RepID=A0A8S5V1Q4_9CAUD|nr:MAG TPA: hypothetical protein [Myoviridae sp. ctJ2i1]